MLPRLWNVGVAEKAIDSFEVDYHTVFTMFCAQGGRKVRRSVDNHQIPGHVSISCGTNRKKTMEQ